MLSLDFFFITALSHNGSLLNFSVTVYNIVDIILLEKRPTSIYYTKHSRFHQPTEINAVKRTQILAFGSDPTKLIWKIGKHIIGSLCAAGSQADRPPARQQGHRHVRSLLYYVILSLSNSLSLLDALWYHRVEEAHHTNNVYGCVRITHIKSWLVGCVIKAPQRIVNLDA